MNSMGRVLSKSALILMTFIVVSFSFFGCGDVDNAQTAQLPDIGISWCDDIDTDDYGEDLQAYIDAVKKAGGNPVLLPIVSGEDEAMTMLESIDGLILTGGEDINPSYYNEEAGPNLEEVNQLRDESDYILLQKALENDVPILAICRGCQLLNVVLGGSLYQDIPTQYVTDIHHRSLDEIDFEYHYIDISQDSLIADIMGAGELNVNSWHHQGIKDLGNDLKVTALAKDGIIEAIEKEDSTFVLGLQFHPEWHVDDGEMEFIKIFEKLIEIAGR